MKPISCVVCAYNEAHRIRGILDAIEGHPALAEIIIVNDGSTDATEEILRSYGSVRVISYPTNRGKTYALSQAIAAASHEYIMFLDADLTGVTADDISALASPVMNGDAEVSISLRRNSLGLFRAIGLDFVSGERVAPASLFEGAVKVMEDLPRWGGEAYMNELIIRRRLRLAVVDWPGVYNVRKYRKVGLLRGSLAEMGMVSDAIRVLSPWGIVRQNLALLGLITARSRHAGDSALRASSRGGWLARLLNASDAVAQLNAIPAAVRAAWTRTET